MKQFYLSIASVMISSLLAAQNWSGTTSGDIYYNQGNVGIGTPSPTSLLDVNGDIAIKYGNALKVNAANDGSWTNTSNRIILRTSWNAEVHDYVDFKVPGSVPNTANMRFTKNGRLGIGTTSPKSPLDVNGDIAIKYGNALKVNAANDGSWTNTSNRIILRTSWNAEVHDYVDFKVPGAVPNTANMRFTKNGRLGIGTTTPDAKLAVNGRIHAKEVKVDLNGWPDFVFESSYKLMTLEDVENYLAEHKHLPEIPSEAEVMENGINLGDMDAKLLQKIEELTLYLIEQHKQLKKAHQNIAELQREVAALKKE
ncbi:hypothetical protein QQ020_13230 [Fulvivirgaceae bacterium BMA12]|uniref:Cell wall surface anchor family protein n=1 Tax=Agaribacillus aureus TaxID=3051825 RepID=A0ABT8L5N5_9BACT|nr:hypothetical protein [Fulvivirgaceae bacterium BMA12]